MSPASLSAAGYAEFDPVATNDSPASKAMNRRIELALQPNISELIELPRATSPGAPGSGDAEAGPSPAAAAPVTQ